PLSSRINYLAGTTVGLYHQHLGRSNLPISQSNLVQPHQYSYSQYMNKDKKTIAKENLFDLQGKTTAARRKKNHCCMNVKYFAITCWTNITKGNFVEFRSFPHPSKAPDQSRSGTPDIQSNKNGKRAIESACLPPPKRLTVRAEAAERRDINNQIADTALTIAEEDVPEAMRYVRKKMPKEFMYRSTNFHESFKYVNNEAQELKQDPVKEYMWDLSFPDCTKELHTAVTNWLNENFRNPHRPKCLVIIGPSGVDNNKIFHYLQFLGKTSFALSLPGKVCHFKGRWCLKSWHKKARYLVFDDIPWDEWENLNFPSKKDMLTANGKVAVTDKYERTVKIDVKVPSIVLLNPGDDGSLSKEPVTRQQIADADYWSRRAVVYRMGEHEHFHKAPSASASGTMDAPIVNHHRPLLGHPDEFAVAQREWLDAQNKRRAAVVSDPLVRSSGMDVEVLSDDSDIEML
ncbi:unnamed protein product, partial [Rotaria sp. Silwood2]